MRTPAAAILWESWRLSRLGLAIMMFLATFGGAALIVSPVDAAWSATGAMMLAGYLALIGPAWAGNVDARKGFSLALGFARPIPTWVLVSVPMAYGGITCAATYLVPVLFLRMAFGVAFPLLPVAALLVTLSLVALAINWATPKSAVRLVAPGLIMLAILWYSTTLSAGNVLAPDRWPDLFSFSAWAYAWMVLICVAAIGSTVAGVTRQRHGDDVSALALPAGLTRGARQRMAFRAWFAARLRVSCPISSPTRAQLWFEGCTVGGRVLATGVMVALAAPVLLTTLDAAGFRGEILVFSLLYAFLPPLVVGLRSLLGVRRKQGISYLSAFTSTRPIGTGRLIGLKVLVTSLALLGAWSAIGASLWFFGIQLGVSGPEAQAGLADSEYVSDFLAVVASPPIIAVILVWAVALLAAAGAIHASFLLNAKRLLLTGLGLTIYITSLVVGASRGWVDQAAFTTLALVLPAAVFLATIYLFRRALTERIFTLRGFSGLVMLWLVFSLAQGWLADPTEWGDAVALVFFALMPLWIVALTLWSFSRLRHG